ncbi:MAG: hypothetical protein ACSLFB_02330 [Acidimicrobiales bacterium]
MIQTEPSPILDIPSQTFEKFLEQLKLDGVSPDVIQNLREAALANTTLTEVAIRAAIFGDGQNS